MNYLVVLFNNKKRKKIINQFKTFDRAENFYNKLIEDNKSVIFETKVENARSCNYELCLLKKHDDSFEKLYIKDDFGRNVLVDLDDPDYKIIRVVKYKVPEKIFDVSNNKKITTEEFIKKYLPKNSIKLISRLNNKVVVQNDDVVKLFSLKDEDESRRFLESLNDYLISVGRIDSIIVIETSKPQKNSYTIYYLRWVLVNNLYIEDPPLISRDRNLLNLFFGSLLFLLGNCSVVKLTSSS